MELFSMDNPRFAKLVIKASSRTKKKIKMTQSKLDGLQKVEEIGEEKAAAKKAPSSDATDL